MQNAPETMDTSEHDTGTDVNQIKNDVVSVGSIEWDASCYTRDVMIINHRSGES